jgi:YesN/AraC family two-component response regulator
MTTPFCLYKSSLKLKCEAGKKMLTHRFGDDLLPCFAVGFNNPNYFSRVFVKEFGVVPSGVRE